MHLSRLRPAIHFKLFVIVLCWMWSGFSTADDTELPPTILLISIDGVRHDYLSLHDAPSLSTLANGGIWVQQLQPVFPTKTFTNHYSLATGLLPRDHGIVDNNMFDPQLNLRFALSDRTQVQNPVWWQGEPIWVTAAKAGMATGTFFFPGSEAAIRGISPTFWYTYDENISHRERTKTVLHWLSLPAAERPRFMTLYFSDVDTAGHNYGPYSAEVAAALATVDAELAWLFAELQTRGLFEQLNTIVSSDHGMSEVNLHNHIVIDELFDTERAERVLYSRELTSIFPKEGEMARIVEQLENNLPAHARVYTADSLPERFAYTGHHRIAPVLVLAEPGWALLRRAWLDNFIHEGSLDRLRGGHGYDNQSPDMQTLLIAHGPAFRQPQTIDSLKMTDIYNVMAAILQISPAPNAGDPAVVSQLLRH